MPRSQAAIPVNSAVKVAQELLENGYVTGRPYLGISYYAVTDAQTAAQLGVNAYGVYIIVGGRGSPRRQRQACRPVTAS